MNHESKMAPSQALAFERFALITKIQDRVRQGFPLSLALEQVSCCPLTLPDGGRRSLLGAQSRIGGMTASTGALPSSSPRGAPTKANPARPTRSHLVGKNRHLAQRHVTGRSQRRG
jgi:hypothetical protein